MGLRYVLASNSRRAGSANAMILPQSCGRPELIKRCMGLLHQSPPLDYALDVIDLLKANATAEELMPVWLADTRRNDFNKRPAWLQHGLHLGCLSAVDAAELATSREERPMRRSIEHAFSR